MAEDNTQAWPSAVKNSYFADGDLITVSVIIHLWDIKCIEPMGEMQMRKPSKLLSATAFW